MVTNREEKVVVEAKLGRIWSSQPAARRCVDELEKAGRLAALL
jgi:hypothetical protein